MPTLYKKTFSFLIMAGAFLPFAGNAQGIIIQSGANMVVSGAAQVIINDAGLNNSGTFTPGTGTVKLTGTTVSPSIAGATNFNHLTIDKSGQTVTLGTSANITGALTITAGTLDLGAKPLTLKSDATGTASVPTILGTLSGATNVTVERYTSDKRAWRLLSVPVSSSQTIKAAWMEGAANASSDPNAPYGTHITTYSGDPNAANFDAVKPASSIRTYAANTWTTTPNTIDLINSNPGYMLFVRGNRAINLNDITAHSAATLRINGTMKQGTQSGITINYSATDYTLVGNPFPAPLDYEYLFNNTTNLSPSFYVWDANLAGTYGVGGYRLVTRTGAGTYEQTPSGGTVAVNNSMRYIQSGQAFLANTAASGSANLVLTELCKAGSNSDLFPFGPSTLDEQMTVNMSVVETDLSVNLTDGIRAKFNTGFTAAVSEEDNFKLSNFNENLSILRDGKSLIVEKRPIIDLTDTLYLTIGNMKLKNYQFDINGIALDHPNLLAKLEDQFLANSTPLNLNGNTIYNFAVTADAASYAADRFKIVYYTSSPLPVNFSAIRAFEELNAIQVEWKVENQLNIARYEIEKSTDGRNFAKIGTQLAIGQNGSNATYKFADINPVTGNNYYRIRSIGIGTEVKLSSIVKVNIGKGAGIINVYPNPVIDNKLNLQFTAMDKGDYILRLLSANGQLVYTTAILHPGGSATQSIQLNKVQAGNYHLEIIQPNKTKTSQSLQIIN